MRLLRALPPPERGKHIEDEHARTGGDSESNPQLAWGQALVKVGTNRRAWLTDALPSAQRWVLPV